VVCPEARQRFQIGPGDRDDHPTGTDSRGAVGGYGGADVLIGVVGESGCLSGAGLDVDCVAVGNELGGGVRGECHPAFARSLFRQHCDSHDLVPGFVSGPR